MKPARDQLLLVFDYAISRKRKTWILWSTVIFLFIFAILLFQILTSARVRNAIRLQKLQRLCLIYSKPGDTVVFDEDTSRGANADNNPDLIRFNSPYGISHVSWWAMPNALFTSIGGLADDLGPTVFMHARQSPAGNTRLVVVIYDMNGGQFAGAAYQPAPWFGKLELKKPPFCRIEAYNRVMESRSWINGFSPNELARVYEGQPDPTDMSHFTIKYEIGTTTGLVDGWLCDDDLINLRPRYGPATLPTEFYDNRDKKAEELKKSGFEQQMKAIGAIPN